MSIPFKCEHCQAAFGVPVEHAGKRGKCPKCGSPILVPMAPDTGTSSMKLRVARPLDASPSLSPMPPGSPPMPPVHPPAPQRTSAPATEPAAAPGFQIHINEPGAPPPNVTPSTKPRVKEAAAPKAETANPAPKRPRKSKDALQRYMLAGSGIAALLAIIVAAAVYFLQSPAPEQTAQLKPSVPAPKPGPKLSALPVTTGAPEPAPDTVVVSVEKGESLPPLASARTKRVTGPTPMGFRDWGQDFTAAQTNAQEHKTDILLMFTGSDWNPHTKSLAQRVFGTSGFLDHARGRYELVVIDFPRTESGFQFLEDRHRNHELQKQFGIHKYNTLMLTDSQGVPYALEGPEVVVEAMERFQQFLDELRERRSERDRMLAAAGEGDPTARLKAGAEATKWMIEHGLQRFYRHTIDGWLELARQHDAANELGQHEVVFHAHWLNRFGGSSPTPAQIKEAIALLESWSGQRTFKDPDVAAGLFVMGAALMIEAGDESSAVRLVTAAQKHSPTDADLARNVEEISAWLKDREQLGSGTGFVIAEKGYILTNHHVIDGPGRIVVRLADKEQPAPASVVLKDEKRDLALLKIAEESAAELLPILFDAKPAGRGAKVAAFGYPLGDLLGSGLKLTEGIISSLPEAKNDGMMLTSCKVNPGNSGGPLCSLRGHVVGIVTAKSASGESVDSFGMAVPASDVLSFLARALPSYKPTPPADGPALELDQVDRLVSPSVVMVLKLREP